jgi:heme o synthase
MTNYISIWVQLMKPRVTLLVLVTVLPGFYLGQDNPPANSVLYYTLLGTFLMSSASFILNQYIEKDKDALMKRTMGRPLPSGKIRPITVLLVALLFIVSAFALLNYYVNLLTALCTFAGLLFYIFIYTILLKPRTDQNVVIGGVAGCVGPLIGYAASSQALPFPAWVLFLMIFFWTPAHFWALAIFLKEDYDSAHFPMMPVIRGVPQTTKAILIYAILYIIFCIVYFFIIPSDKIGLIYLTGTVSSSMLLLYYSFKLNQDHSKETAKRFFFYSIAHLFFINFLIMFDYVI